MSRYLMAFRRTAFTPGPRHEPIGYPQHLPLSNHSESELLVETYVLRFIGLKVRKAAAVIYDCAEGAQHGGAYPLTLAEGIDRDRTQVPVRFSWVAARP